MHSDCQLVIFDFDGVIVESSEVKHHCFLLTASEFVDAEIVKKLDLALYKELVGAERSRIADWLVNESGLDKEKFLQNFAKNLAEKEEEIEVVEGMKEFLESLVSEKKRLAIVSAAPKGDILRILKRVGIDAGMFCSILGSEDGKKVQSLRQVLAKCALSPEQAVFYGDMPSDYAAAQQCGIPFVRVHSLMGVRSEWA